MRSDCAKGLWRNLVSDTAVCRPTRRTHDIFSNPFHNITLTTFHLGEPAVRMNCRAFDLSGSGDEGGIKRDERALLVPNIGNIARVRRVI